MNHSALHQQNQGFALVELSIVLVIIGLLTGGIFSGQSLIHAAELRAVTTEYELYKSATLTFRDKYLAIPGDMRNATKFWGAANPTPATCTYTAGTGTQTCDGNGDGRLTENYTASSHVEHLTYWQHLANAGFITGQFSGMTGPGDYNDTEAGVNIPVSKLDTGGWMVRDDAGGPFHTLLFPVATVRHNFYLGVSWPADLPRGSILTAEEMWNIDTKIDDGKPGMGSVTSFLTSTPWTAPNCATSDDPATSEYKLSLSSKECVIFMDAGF